MRIFQFMSDSPFLSFFIAMGMISALKFICALPFRALNIWKHGWPPEYCDADGDIKKQSAERGDGE